MNDKYAGNFGVKKKNNSAQQYKETQQKATDVWYEKNNYLSIIFTVVAWR